MYYNKSKDEVLKELQVDLSKGLSDEEVKLRLEKYGENRLQGQKKQSIWRLLFDQINDAMIYILLAASVISIFLGEVTDAIIIAIVIVLNAVIGVVQESKAEKSLEALQKLSTPKALVKRNGKIIEIPSEKVVVGDLIVLDAGRYIPCDLRLIETANLKIEESALTGESVPVEKDSGLSFPSEQVPLGDQLNMAFSSTLVTYGRGIGVAVATGMNTEIGKIAKMIGENVKEMTPLQKKLEQLGKILGTGAVIICVVIFGIGLFQGRNPLELFMTAIALAVAAIPEGLPAIVTVVLALGVQRMIKKNAIIRKLPAVETLGSVNVICSDKTGTLTQNKMTVTKFFSDNVFEDIEKLATNNPIHSLMLQGFSLCTDATFTENKTGDPTEIALLEAASKFEIIDDVIKSEHPRIGEVPFDSDRKLMTTVNKYENGYYVFTKGAIDNLLKLTNYIYVNGKTSKITKEDKENILKQSNEMSKNALRVLALGYKKLDNNHFTNDTLEEDLTFVGLVGMIDPPRLEVRDSIQLCKDSGIKTIMITGDHKTTAFAIAKELGIAEKEEEALSGSELDEIPQEQFNTIVNKYRVFARVSPEHKVRIVKAFKSQGNIVSMTGDGVNDAPSLKAADIGVAMGITGTDVAKGAADMVLTDDNFSTIVSAVREGRNIYANIKKSVIFLLSCNGGEIISILGAILLNLPTPLRSIHLLWVNLITDSLPAISLGVDPDDPDIMKESPRNQKESIFHGVTFSLFFNSILIGLITLIAFVLGGMFHSSEIDAAVRNLDLKQVIAGFAHLSKTGAMMYPQTMAFIVLSISQLVHSFNLRSFDKSIFQVGLFTNKYLIGSLILGIFLQYIIISVPFLAKVFQVRYLTGRDWLYVIVLCITPLIVNEIIKIFRRAKKKTK